MTVFMWIVVVIAAFIVGSMLGMVYNFDWKAYYDYKLKSEEISKANGSSIIGGNKNE